MLGGFNPYTGKPSAKAPTVADRVFRDDTGKVEKEIAKLNIVGVDFATTRVRWKTKVASWGGQDFATRLVTKQIGTVSRQHRSRSTANKTKFVGKIGGFTVILPGFRDDIGEMESCKIPPRVCRKT
jgi:hypothetical protein